MVDADDTDSTLPPRGSTVQGGPHAIRQDARYEPLALLGTGTFGEVHRVRDTLLGRSAAMKVLRERFRNRPAVVARFIDEAQAAAQLQHPGILPIYELGWLPDGSPFYTMREVRGDTLKIAVRGGMPLPLRLAAMVQVADAIGYAHERGVIHRDLKPGNVLLGSHGEVLVVDWGLAKVVDPDQRFVQLSRRREETLFRTATGQITGTPAYMPPEQARGTLDEIDERSDTYALGALLYFCLSGEPPYTGISGLHITRDVLEGPPVPVQERVSELLPAEVVGICERAMNRDRAERYANGAAVADALRDALR